MIIYKNEIKTNLINNKIHKYKILDSKKIILIKINISYNNTKELVILIEKN